MNADELRNSAFRVNEWCREYGQDSPNFDLCLAIGMAAETLIIAVAEIVERMDKALGEGGE